MQHYAPVAPQYLYVYSNQTDCSIYQSNCDNQWSPPSRDIIWKWNFDMWYDVILYSYSDDDKFISKPLNNLVVSAALRGWQMWWWDTDDQIWIYRFELVVFFFFFFFYLLQLKSFLWSNYLSLKAQLLVVWMFYDDMVWYCGSIINICYEVKSSVSCIICKIMVHFICSNLLLFTSTPSPSTSSPCPQNVRMHVFFFFYKSQY